MHAPDPVQPFVAVLVIHLHFPDAGSLKGKRRELAPIKAHLRQRLGVSVAEIDHHDRWQRATLAAAIVSRTLAGVEEAAAGVERWLGSRWDTVRVERTVASLEDLRP